MTSMKQLYRSYQRDAPSTSGTLQPLRQLRHRNNSNPHLMPSNSLVQTNPKHLQISNKASQIALNQSKNELKKYCLARLKPSTDNQDKLYGPRNHRSLKHINKERSVRIINRTRLGKGSSEGLPFLTDNQSLKSSNEKNRTISIKFGKFIVVENYPFCRF